LGREIARGESFFGGGDGAIEEGRSMRVVRLPRGHYEGRAPGRNYSRDDQLNAGQFGQTGRKRLCLNQQRAKKTFLPEGYFRGRGGLGSEGGERSESVSTKSEGIGVNMKEGIYSVGKAPNTGGNSETKLIRNRTLYLHGAFYKKEKGDEVLTILHAI